MTTWILLRAAGIGAYLMLFLAVAWGLLAAHLWQPLKSTVFLRLLFMVVAGATLVPLIIGAFHTARIQARHGLRCPFCGHGLGGTDGRTALRSGQCPECEHDIISRGGYPSDAANAG